MIFVWTVPGGILTEFLAFNDPLEKQDLDSRGAGSVIDLALSPDGNLVGLARNGGASVLIDPRNDQRVYLDGHHGDGQALAFSPDGKTVVSGTHIRPCVRLYDAANGKEMASFDVEGGEPTPGCVRFSPDGNQIAAGVTDGSIRLLASDLSKELRCLQVSGDRDKIQAIAFAAKADLMAGAIRHKICLFAVSSGQQLSEWREDERSVSAIALSPDGGLLAAGYAGEHPAKDEQPGGFVNVWNVETGRLVIKLD